MRCSKCGREFADGDIRYAVRIEISGGTGGTVALRDVADIDRKIALWAGLAARESMTRLENSVRMQLRFVLCPDCRQVFVANPLNKSLDSAIPDSLPRDDEL